MVHSRSASLPQNSTVKNERPVSLMVRTTGNTNPIGTNELVLNPIVTTNLMLGVMVTLPMEKSIPTTPRPTSVPLVDPKPSYVSNFTMPQV